MSHELTSGRNNEPTPYERSGNLIAEDLFEAVTQQLDHPDTVLMPTGVPGEPIGVYARRALVGRNGTKFALEIYAQDQSHERAYSNGPAIVPTHIACNWYATQDPAKGLDVIGRVERIAEADKMANPSLHDTQKAMTEHPLATNAWSESGGFSRSFYLGMGMAPLGPNPRWIDFDELASELAQAQTDDGAMQAAVRYHEEHWGPIDQASNAPAQALVAGAFSALGR